jgi:hypothetical protein
VRTDRAAALLLAGALACREASPPAAIAPGKLTRAREGPARSLLALSPSESPAGVIFQKQPTGEAAIAVLGTGLAPGDTVAWGGRPLNTTFAHSRLLTAIVPPEVLGEPGEVEVTVENRDPTLARLATVFRILPTARTPPAN